MGLHVDTGVLYAESHNCGISSFLPKFTVVGGFEDRYYLSFVCVSSYVDLNTLLQQGYFLVGLMGAKWGRCVKNLTILCVGISGQQKIPQSLKTRIHKMSRCCTTLPPVALPSLSMETSTMDPNRGAEAPYESNAGDQRP